MIKTLLSIILLCGLSSFLSSCGQSGRLYLPTQTSLPTQGSTA